MPDVADEIVVVVVVVVADAAVAEAFDVVD